MGQQKAQGMFMKCQQEHLELLEERGRQLADVVIKGFETITSEVRSAMTLKQHRPSDLSHDDHKVPPRKDIDHDTVLSQVYPQHCCKEQVNGMEYHPSCS